MPDELQFLNMCYDHIKVLRYFDALNESFYEYLFSDIIPDNIVFSNEETQTQLFEVLSKSPTFKMFNSMPIPDGMPNFISQGICISYRFSGNKVKYFEISIGNKQYRRDLNEI